MMHWEFIRLAQRQALITGKSRRGKTTAISKIWWISDKLDDIETLQPRTIAVARVNESFKQTFTSYVIPALIGPWGQELLSYVV